MTDISETVLYQRGLHCYFDALAHGEKAPTSIAKLMPDGVILAAADVTIHHAQTSNAMAIPALESLTDAARIKYGDSLPTPVATIQFEWNPENPWQPDYILS